MNDKKRPELFCWVANTLPYVTGWKSRRIIRKALTDNPEAEQINVKCSGKAIKLKRAFCGHFNLITVSLADQEGRCSH